MKIVVIGGSGLIGSTLTDAQGHRRRSTVEPAKFQCLPTTSSNQPCSKSVMLVIREKEHVSWVAGIDSDNYSQIAREALRVLYG